MFTSLTDGPLPYTDPWVAPIEARFRALRQPLPRVAWVYERPDTSTFRYRVFNMVEALAADGRAAASWFTVPETPLLMRFLCELDVLVICRTRYDAMVARLLSAARANRVHVLFDCDDLVFDTRYVQLLVETLDQDTAREALWDDWFASMGRIEATMRHCDGGIATNSFLADHLTTALGGRPTGIIPNFLNSRQQDISSLLLKVKRKRGFRGDGPVVVGYFSGTPSHNRDFEVAAPALARLLDDDPHVGVRIVGFLDRLGPLEKHRDRVEFVPLQDWINLQRVIAEVEINIAPLQENRFTNCKSELKFFEAAVVGTWTIATPTHTFRAAIRDGLTGRLARAHEWDDALREGVALMRGRKNEFTERAEVAAASVLEAYGWDRQADSILRSVGILK